MITDYVNVCLYATGLLEILRSNSSLFVATGFFIIKQERLLSPLREEHVTCVRLKVQLTN
jgi:hypothetical protein